MNLDMILYNIRNYNYYKKLSFHQFLFEHANIKCVNCSKIFLHNHGSETGACFKFEKHGDRAYKILFCYKPENSI